MMELCLRYPRHIQLLSRILSCNFSTVASSAISVKPKSSEIVIAAIRDDVSNISSLADNKYYRRMNTSQYTVPFVFPKHFDHHLRVLCVPATEVINATSSDGSKQNEAPKGKPTPEQVEIVYLNLCENIPRLFTTTQDFRIYDHNMVFEDNIRKKVIVGLREYALNLSLLKLKSHIKYAHVKMLVLRATKHPEEGTVKVRWRIVRGPGLIKMLASFWKLNPVTIFKTKTVADSSAEWVDGFSIFYINDKGMITRHVCDKMMPDDDKVVEESKKSKLNVAI